MEKLFFLGTKSSLLSYLGHIFAILLELGDSVALLLNDMLTYPEFMCKGHTATTAAFICLAKVFPSPRTA
jgi:hypothetical protein